MIQSFKHRGLEIFFSKDSYKGIPAQHAARLIRLLDRLDCALKPEDMNLPGYKFHQLQGKRKKTFAVLVSGNLRLTFKFDDENAIDVDLEDYH